MAAIHSVDTKPELIVRRTVHSLGYRYGLHRRDLPGTPDLVFNSRRCIILVHGCYWHRHRCNKGRSVPNTNRSFWQSKFEANKRRDRKNRRKLREMGWEILIVWECQTQEMEKLEERLVQFLDGSVL